MTTSDAPILSVRDLAVIYPLGRGRSLRATEKITFDVHNGETLALVGESGCGKSSVARAIMQLHRNTEGEIRVEGHDLNALSRTQLKALRPKFQMIFQDPISSLNPRRRVREILEAPLRIIGIRDATERAHRVAKVLELVSLDPQTVLNRYPHEFSGGQCQRISIARALVLEPALLICDEAVSALDVSVRAQVLNLLNELRERLGLSMLFISHDLAVVRNIADRVAVMYLGHIAEIGAAGPIFEKPAHPYTAALLSAVPEPDPEATCERLPMKSGELPSPLSPPPGCRFHTRCPVALERCRRIEPQLIACEDGRSVACHNPFALRVERKTKAETSTAVGAA
jgi:peptide/nickel transport system ATP-binding protein